MKPATAVILIWWPLLLAGGLNGCTVKYVADYDAATFEETIRVSKQIDRFYGELLETSVSDRPYRKYVSRYIDIETELRSLHLRNTVRPLNSESEKIIENILALWQKYRQRHRQKDIYSDGNAKFERERLARMFISALNAETAKNIPAPHNN